MANEEIREAAAKRLGVSSANGNLHFDRHSLLTGMGGWLGIVEAVLPSVLFGMTFAIASSALISVLVAGGSSIGFILFRLITRKSAASALVGAFAVGFAAWLALREGGNAVDYFIPGFITNASYGAVLLLSILIRWPIIGVLVELLRGHDFSWRKDKRKVFVYSWITAFWVVFFLLRLAVQLPLYFAGNTEALATARVIMGPPLYALVIVTTWLMLRGTVLKPR